MPTFVVNIYAEQAKIKIQLTALVNTDSEAAFNPLPAKLGFDVLEYYRFTNKKVFETEVDTYSYPASFIEATYKNHPEKYKQYTKIYTLPTTPNYALHFLRLLALFLKNTPYIVLSSPFAKLINDQDKKLIPSIEELDSPYKFPYCDALIPACINIICAIQNLALYQPVQQALDLISKYALQRDKLLINCDSIDDRASAWYGGMMLQVIDPKVEMAEKIKILFTFTRHLIRIGQKEELSYMLRTLSLLARQHLYKLCLDKPSHEGGAYHWNYTEWDLLRYAAFTLRPDGRLSLKNIQKNPAYQKIYAPGKRNHSILEAELRYLGQYLELEFATDSNFHVEIIFTEACTAKLKARGLHFNEAYVKQLLLTRNQWMLFNQAYKYPHNKYNQVCRLYHAPLDLIEQIRNNLNLRSDVIIDPKELEQVGSFGRKHPTQLTITEVEEVTEVKLSIS